jgi:hypothetical protein
VTYKLRKIKDNFSVAKRKNEDKVERKKELPMKSRMTRPSLSLPKGL